MRVRLGRMLAACGLLSGSVIVCIAGCADVLGIVAERRLSDAGEALSLADSESPGPADAGPLEAGPWDCLASTSAPPDPSAAVQLTVYAYDAVKPFSSDGKNDAGAATSDLQLTTYSPLSGVTVRACPDPLDPDCQRTGSTPITTNDGGRSDLTVAQDFPGFIRMNRDDLIPSDFYPGSFLPSETSQRYYVPLMSNDSAQVIASALGVPISLGADSGVGMMFLGVFDCHDHHATGVTYTLSSIGPSTLIFYMKSGLPTTSSTQTDDFGGGGAINVPAGGTTITATRVDGRVALGSANVVVHPGGIIQLWFRARSGRTR